MDLRHNVFWQVSLSNGETLFEQKGDYCHVDGEFSPWQRLLKHIMETKALITSLSLYTSDGRTFNLPSAGNNPKFKPFHEADKPIDYNFCHFLARESLIENNVASPAELSDWFAVIEAIYPDHKLQIWVDEKNTKNSWTLMVKT